MEFVDSPNSSARPFKYPLFAAFIKNFTSIRSLVRDVISDFNKLKKGNWDWGKNDKIVIACQGYAAVTTIYFVTEKDTK